jgi:hypothetical protein
MCPGVNSASKNEYQDHPGAKGGRCIRLTTYHLPVPIVNKSGGLNLLEPCRPVQACNGTALYMWWTSLQVESQADICSEPTMHGVGFICTLFRIWTHHLRPCAHKFIFLHCESTAFLQNATTDQLLPLSVVHKLVWCSVCAGKTSGCRFIAFFPLHYAPMPVIGFLSHATAYQAFFMK